MLLHRSSGEGFLQHYYRVSCHLQVEVLQQCFQEHVDQPVYSIETPIQITEYVTYLKAKLSNIILVTQLLSLMVHFIYLTPSWLKKIIKKNKK